MQSPSVGYILFALVCTVTQYIVDPGSSCKAEMPPVGPRLLQAKALFGEVMRQCKKEIFVYLKSVPPHLLSKIIPISCAVYHECKRIHEGNELEPVVNCCISAFKNKSAPLYTKLNLSDAYGHGAEAGLVCTLKVAQERGAGLQALDDEIGFMRKAALSFGWT
ncbi:uncharacterized protein [Dermacentor andersoni]|uniref:uncharacterized protein n=1 Tax=Dermacentor andersoni TaxID=34620 RepID=UPI0024159D85|nr:uncharacterized protein LOC129388363 [Dermacentor andersoni]